MDWLTDENGALLTPPLIAFHVRTPGDIVVLVKIESFQGRDPNDETRSAVQVSMTAQQARDLAADLLRAAGLILESSPQRPN